jgi:hypothetical protein
MTNRGELAALAVVATLAAVSIRASKRRGLGQANVFRSNLSMIPPSSTDLAEMVLADYNPRDFISIFPDSSRMKGRSVEVHTFDVGPVLIHPRRT